MSGKATLLPCHLTERQRQVMQGMCDGKNNKEIGFALDITEKCVEWHKYALWKKTGCRTVQDTWSLGVYWGMLPCPCRHHTLKRIMEGKE